MQFCAKARYIKFSPYKLRPLADVIRGKNAQFALNWLATHANQRTLPLTKVVKSAVANAMQQGKCEPTDLYITDLRVDQGPMFRYYKPGAMGRSTILRKRFSHIHVVVKPQKTVNQKTKEV